MCMEVSWNDQLATAFVLVSLAASGCGDVAVRADYADQGLPRDAARSSEVSSLGVGDTPADFGPTARHGPTVLAQVKAADVVTIGGVVVSGQGCRPGTITNPSEPGDLAFQFDDFSIEIGRETSKGCELVLELIAAPGVQVMLKGIRGLVSIAPSPALNADLTVVTAFLEGPSPPAWTRVVPLRGGPELVFDGIVPRGGALLSQCGGRVRLRASLELGTSSRGGATSGKVELTEFAPVVDYLPCVPR